MQEDNMPEKPEKPGLLGVMILVLAATAILSVWLGDWQSRSENEETQAHTQSILSHGDPLSPQTSISPETETEKDSTQTVSGSTVDNEKPPLVRVLIQSGDYGSLLHDEIKLTSSGPYTLSWAGKEEIYSGDRILTLTPGDERLKAGALRVSAEQNLQLVNVQRECGYPGYAGTMEIRLQDGKLLLINEVELEAYLKGVVPGEMLLSYGVEALKVQAVCARSYVWKCLESPGYPEYGAHVDDSVNFQVYNNQEHGEAADQAVEETAGEVLSYDGEVVNTYYFSTSCGTTTDMSIWQEEPESYPYYPAAAMSVGREVLNLSDEDTFRAFIDWYEDSYDAGADFYRWQISLSEEQLTDSLREYLEKKGLAAVGRVTALEVTKRGSSGIIEELTVTGSGGRAVLQKQGAVREALGNSAMEIVLPDGRTVKNWKMLPSAFFYMEEQREGDRFLGCVLHGGGYGHGVGMSQGRGLWYGAGRRLLRGDPFLFLSGNENHVRILKKDLSCPLLITKSKKCHFFLKNVL